MIGIASLFIVVLLSLLITRIATVMLTLTGLSRETAQFQARSAFSGVGFTTSESEAVVNHPLRRRIINALVLFGNAGVVTVLVSLLLSFSDVDDNSEVITRLGLLVGVLTVLWLLARSRWADRALSGLIERGLRRFTDLDTRDYVGLLHLAAAWVVAEIEVQEHDWMCDVPIRDLDLPEEGVVILGINRQGGRWVGAPSGKARIQPGDVVVLYGTRAAIDRLDNRTRDAEGELDRLSAQVDFTEEFLAQQEAEKAEDVMTGQDRGDGMTPTLTVQADDEDAPGGGPPPG